MKKIYHIYYYADVNMGWGVGKTKAFVLAENKNDALNMVEYFCMGYGIDEISKEESIKLIEKYEQEVAEKMASINILKEYLNEK